MSHKIMFTVEVNTDDPEVAKKCSESLQEDIASLTLVENCYFVSYWKKLD